MIALALLSPLPQPSPFKREGMSLTFFYEIIKIENLKFGFLDCWLLTAGC